MTELVFTKATKAQTWARIALDGPSGSGKTWTALTFAAALGDRTALIDTERRSASKYADVFDFDTLALTTFEPETLIKALAAAARADYPVAVIDSWSHFWMGTGGMLEQVDQAARRSGGGNSFAGWKEMRPVEREMIDAIVGYPGHVIATLRVKTEYAVDKDDRGRSVPRKVGMKPEQRDGLEYEFDLVGSLDADNTLVVTKSRCPTLAGAVVSKPGEDFARKVRDWLDEGVDLAPLVAKLRDAALDPHVTCDDLFGLAEQAKVAGVETRYTTDGTGDRLPLGQFIRNRWREVNAGARGAAA